MRKPGADKIALLGFLVLGLTAAHLIIVAKSAVKLSEPIKLICDDLSVSLPSGNGWQCEERWRYYENTFAIGSIFLSGRGSVTAMTNCRYLLAPVGAATDAQFRQKAVATNGTIEKTGQITTGKLTVDWALIKKQAMALEMFIGITRLPNNRQVNIEVFQASGNTELAERIFKNVAESLKFKNNRSYEAGGKIITETKNRRISSFFDSQSNEIFFTVSDSKGNPVGFTMDSLSSNQGSGLNIEGTSCYYLQRPYAQQQIVRFKSDERFDELTCRTDFGSVFGAKAVELQLDKTAALTVSKLIPQAEKNIYQVGPAAVPEFFINEILSQMTEGPYRRILIDIIEADGKIVPALISKADVPAGGDEQNAAYLLNMEVLDGRGFSQKIYLDDRKQVLKILLQQKDLYVLERSDLENIAKEFPEQAAYILERSRLKDIQ